MVGWQSLVNRAPLLMESPEMGTWVQIPNPPPSILKYILTSLQLYRIIQFLKLTNLTRIMRLTLNNISKAIKEKTGVDAQIVRGEGYFYFVSDTDEKVDTILNGAYTASVYVNTLGVFSIERWVEEFESIWNEAEADYNDYQDHPVFIGKPVKLAFGGVS